VSCCCLCSIGGAVLCAGDAGAASPVLLREQHCLRLLAVQLCFSAAGAGAALFAVGAPLLGRTATAGAAFFAVLLPHGLLLPLPVQHGVLLLLLLLAQLCLLLLLLLHVQHYCVLLLLFAQLWLLVSDKRQRKSVLGNLLVQYCLVQQHRWRGCWCSIVCRCFCCCSIVCCRSSRRLSPLLACAAAVFVRHQPRLVLLRCTAVGDFRLCLRVQLRCSGSWVESPLLASSCCGWCCQLLGVWLRRSRRLSPLPSRTAEFFGSPSANVSVAAVQQLLGCLLVPSLLCSIVCCYC